MSKAKGLTPKKRPQAVARQGKKLTANQWQATPQQIEFMRLWLSTDSPCFGNAYQSAIQAGYSEHYARQLASPAVGNDWIKDYTRMSILTADHIKQGLQSLALKANNSRSPDDTRLKAYEILAKITGVLNDKGTHTTVVVQPILAGASVKPKTVIDATVTPVKETP